ncbi:MAG: STT3 domain-containing protein [Nanoarchaeota archaeon]
MSEEDKLIQERKEAVVKFFKKRPEIWIYIALVLLVIFSIWLRTLNTPALRDITTGEYTLGPDLDPFLFLRWAEYIVDNGHIMHIDTLRYVPLGFDTESEMMFLSYLIAWFHNGLNDLGWTSSVVESAVYFPAMMFGLTVIAFFLLARRIGKDSLGEIKAGIMALIASLFLTVIPSLLPRTIAGIPEKESVGFFFMFLAFYFYLEGWKSKNLRGNIIWGVLAGISTAAMALVWGGFVYILVTLSLVLLITLILGQIDKNKVFLSVIWIVVAYVIMSMFSLRYTFGNLLSSTTSLLPLGVICVCIINLVLFKTSFKRYFESEKLKKIPEPIITLVLVLVVGILFALIFLGPGFIFDKIGDFTKPLINPITNRFGVTVAENRQPFFSEWASEFGPVIPFTSGAPLYFWLFVIGAIYLYYNMLSMFNKREKTVMTVGFAFFLFAMIFSRFSASSVFNGTSFISLAFYVIGAIIFVGSFGYYYYQNYYKDKEKFSSIDISLIFLFALFFFSIVSARGSVRTIMVLVPAVSIIVPYMAVNFISKIIEEAKNE